jgi:hypothetical protein
MTARRPLRVCRQLDLAFIAALAAIVPAPAAAHGFGQRYDLPIPLSFYLFGASAAVAVTFVIVGLFVRERAAPHPPMGVELRLGRFGWLICNPALIWMLRIFALGILILTIVAGLIGDQSPYRNIAPTMVWVIVWVGLVYVSAFIGNIWTIINPWRTLFELIGRLARPLSQSANEFSIRLRYPAALGVWPAFVLLFALAWIELVYPNPAIPHFLAVLLLGYSALTITAMFLFGCETWLQHGEVFTLLFGTYARFAPLDLPAKAQQSVRLRPFGAGLLPAHAVSSSMMAFVLLLLATVLYDGALGTPEWESLEKALAPYLAGFGDLKLAALRSAGLLVFWLIFCGSFVAISAMMRTASANHLAPLTMAREFALTLVPIAIGYHLAHYLTFLLIQGQYIIPLASDPFGFGWNLFGTAGYRVDIGIVDARFAWYTAVAAILLGHIAAVYLAHRRAIEVIDTRAAALRSQIPLTALMVVYTFISLSILAEPIVERRAPAKPLAVGAEIDIPQDAVLPQPGSGRLAAVGAGKTAKQKLTYRVLGSAFHDGTRMTAADLLYAYSFAYRWGGANAADEATSDAFVAESTAVMRARLSGIRVIGTDTTSKSFRFGDFEYVRELFVVEVYFALPGFEPEQDAVVAPPWSTVPWHLLVLMEEAVARGWAAFSEMEARRRGVEWLDLVRSSDINARLAALVEDFERQGFRPEPLERLVSVQEARKRWAALAAFYKERGHFLVTNGPYQLKRWSADSVTVEAFRDLSYPLGVGSYDAYAVPRHGFITSFERDKGRIKITGDIELIQTHMRSYDIVRKPLRSLSADVIKRSSPECRYFLTDGQGRVVSAGQVAVATDASCYIDLAESLSEGQYTLLAQLIVNGNAMNAAIARFVLDMPIR